MPLRILSNYLHYTQSGSISTNISNYVSGISVTGSSPITGQVNMTGIGGMQLYYIGTNEIRFSGGAAGTITNNNTYYINSGSGLFVFRSGIENGTNKQFISFPAQLDNKPLVASALHNDGYDTIIPHQISGISSSGFWAIFANSIPNTGYYLDVWACNSTGTGLATTIIINNITGVVANSEFIVYKTGNQLISGRKDFENTTYFNGNDAGIAIVTSNIGIDSNNYIEFADNSLREGAGANVSLNWSNRYLMDSNAIISLNWENRILSGDWTVLGTMRNSGNSFITGISTGHFISTNDTGRFYPMSNPNNYATSGNIQSTGQTLFNIIRSFTGVAVTGRGTNQYIPKFTSDGSGIINSNIIDSGNQIIFYQNTQTTISQNGNLGIHTLNPISNIDISGHLKARSITGEMIEGTNTSRINMTNTTVYDTSLIPSIDWTNRQLIGVDELTTVDWNSRILSNDGGASVHWGDKVLSGDWNILGSLSINNLPANIVRIFSSNKLNFKNTGNYNLLTVPTNYLFILDTMEILTTNIDTPNAAPYIKFGNTSNLSAYQAPNQTVSNSQYARHIYDNPQDAISEGTIITFSITTGSTAVMHSGYAIIKGYLTNI